MIKVGITTFYSGNYGSILQSYALQTAIKNCGVEPVIIKHDLSGAFPGSRIMDNVANRGFIDTFRFYADSIRTKLSQDEKMKLVALERANALGEFVLKWLNLTDRRYGRNDFRQCVSEADIFVTGSDQVWNPKITAWSKFYWLSFLPSYVPKFSYAPSMGVTDLSGRQRRRISDFLEGYYAISVREQSTADLLNYSGVSSKRVQAVTDPTLLLDPGHWIQMASQSDGVKVGKPYMFAYILRGDKKQRDLARRIAKLKNLKLVVYPYLEPRPTSEDAETWGDVRLLDDTPWDFLARIQNASVVLTDSFHCALFSTLFKREFYVVPKVADTSSQSTRITNFLEKCGLEDRLIEQQLLECSVPDFSQSELAISQMREDGRAYLSGSISGCLANLK